VEDSIGAGDAMPYCLLTTMRSKGTAPKLCVAGLSEEKKASPNTPVPAHSRPRQKEPRPETTMHAFLFQCHAVAVGATSGDVIDGGGMGSACTISADTAAHNCLADSWASMDRNWFFQVGSY
jgi:hypothetical protein